MPATATTMPTTVPATSSLPGRASQSRPPARSAERAATAGHAEQADQAAEQADQAAEQAVARARRAGVTAVWTGDCSGTVELARLAGPHDGLLTGADGLRLRLVRPGPWPLADPGVRVALYEYCLARGTQFDIYRWLNLCDLAAVWARLRLPHGVRGEWARVLVAAGLLDADA